MNLTAGYITSYSLRSWGLGDDNEGNAVA